MFRRFSMYIDIVASPKYYAPSLNIIEAFANVCEPITNVSESYEKPNFIYDLLIIEYDKFQMRSETLTSFITSYTSVIVINVPNEENCYDLLNSHNIHRTLRQGFFISELESLLKDYMHLELLKNENTLLDNLFNSAQNSIVITDKKGYIQYANPYFEQLSEYRKDELIFNSPNVLKTGQHPIEFYKNLWDTINNGTVWEGIFINQSKNQNVFYEEATITPILNTHGDIEKFLKIGKNITREKMLLAELSKEIKIAKKVINTFLPASYEDSFLSFEYALTDFNEIGGDFIYFNRTIPGKYYFAIIDVMGHGISSALVAITVAQKFDDQLYYRTLDSNVQELNAMLCRLNKEDSDSEKFVTGLFFEIDVITKKLRYINAGHPDMIVHFKDGTSRNFSSNNMILGILEVDQMNINEINCEDIHKVITFTDGLYENHNLNLDEAIQCIQDSIETVESTSKINALFTNLQHVKDDATICLITLK